MIIRRYRKIEKEEKSSWPNNKFDKTLMGLLFIVIFLLAIEVFFGILQEFSETEDQRNTLIYYLTALNCILASVALGCTIRAQKNTVPAIKEATIAIQGLKEAVDTNNRVAFSAHRKKRTNKRLLRRKNPKFLKLPKERHRGEDRMLPKET